MQFAACTYAGMMHGLLPSNLIKKIVFSSHIAIFQLYKKLYLITLKTP